VAATTVETLRDRMYALIEAATPTRRTGDRFHAFRNEGDASIAEWAETHPVGCRRRFQVRDIGTADPPVVTDLVNDDQIVTFEITVAYPQTGRDGTAQGHDRDDTIEEDERLLESTVGLYGHANMNGLATWISSDVERVEGRGVDFLIVRQTMRYWRRVA
jgi:hypothetical protein